MRVFVTGGNGFIGSVVVRALAALGHEVVCLLRPGCDTSRLAGVRYVRVDGDVRDAQSIRAGVAGCDHSVHLAAPGGWQADDPALLAEVIEGGTRNLLEAITDRPGHRAVLVSSTAAIDASDTPRIFDERSPFTISDRTLHYAQAKRCMELIARAAVERGVAAIVVNPAEVYGPGDASFGTASNLIDFATSRPVLVTAGGTGIVHVDDVAQGVVAALERGRPGERYILSGENVTIRQLAQLVLELVGRKATIVDVPRTLGRAASRIAIRLRIPLPYNPHVVPYATRYWFVDNAKARLELGVQFRDARATIESTLAWLRAIGRLPATELRGDRGCP